MVLLCCASCRGDEPSGSDHQGEAGVRERDSLDLREQEGVLALINTPVVSEVVQV